MVIWCTQGRLRGREQGLSMLTQVSVHVLPYLRVLSVSREESISLWWKKELKTWTLSLRSYRSTSYHRYLYVEWNWNCVMNIHEDGRGWEVD